MIGIVNYRDYDWLYNQYITLNKTCEQISGEIDVKRVTIHKWVRKLGLPVKSKSDYKQPLGRRHWNYKGGFYINSAGYKLVLMPNHKRADLKGYVYEHYIVAEKIMGREITGVENIHHINHKRSDNRPQNLMIFPSCREHSKYEALCRHEEWKKYGKVCGRCGIRKFASEFLKNWRICLQCERKRIKKWQDSL